MLVCVFVVVVHVVVVVHLEGWNYCATMLSHYCIFTCLLNIFPSLMTYTALLPQCWGVRISYTYRLMGPSLAPVSYHVGIACVLHIFSSICLTRQCQGYWHRPDLPSQEEVGTTLFRVCSHSFVCWSGSLWYTRHFFPITGQIKDILVSSRW